MFDVPDIMKHFEEIAKDLTAFRAEMDKAIRSDIDESSKAYLKQLGKSMDEALAEVRRTLPATVDYCRTTNAETKKTMGELEKQFEEMKKKSAEVEAAAAKAEQANAAAARAYQAEMAPAAQAPEAAPQPELTLDSLPTHLDRYRAELLALLKDGKLAPAAKKTDDREIWQDWSRYSNDQ
jgi:hypothetical protein